MLALPRPESRFSTNQPLGDRPLGWFSYHLQKASPSCETVGAVTILMLTDRIRARKQRRQLLRLMHQVPVNRTQLVLDVSQVDDDDDDLPRLICDLIDEAQRCRLDVCVAGVSSKKQAFLELTRVMRFVRCYSDRRDAVCDLLISNPTSKQLTQMN